MVCLSNNSNIYPFRQFSGQTVNIFLGDDDGYDGPSSVEAEANSSDCGFDDLDMGDMGDIPEPSYPLSNPRRNSMEGDMQVRLFNHTRGCQKV